jgi:hypothetical protein
LRDEGSILALDRLAVREGFCRDRVLIDELRAAGVTVPAHRRKLTAKSARPTMMIVMTIPSLIS